MFRFALAFVLSYIPAVCLAQIASPLLTPGTTPLYYKITFAGTPDAALNGKTFLLRQEGPNMWQSEFRVAPVTPVDAAAFDISRGPWVPPVPGRRVFFYHAGYNPTSKKFVGGPGGGIISANVAGIVGMGKEVGEADFIPTAGERDGNGPFVITLKTGGTATVQP